MTKASKIDGVAKIICNNEFGSSSDRWDRLKKRAHQGGGFIERTVERLTATASASEVVRFLDRSK